MEFENVGEGFLPITNPYSFTTPPPSSTSSPSNRMTVLFDNDTDLVIAVGSL